MKKYKLLKISTVILVAIALLLISPKIINKYKISEIEQQNENTLNEVLKGKIQQTSTEEDPAPAATPPESYYLEVPFICQAPLETEANWKYHEESCEEAAVLQAYLYERGKSVTKQEANEEILKMIDWEKRNLGSHKDLYAIELKKFILGYYGLKESEVKIKFAATLDDIKKVVANNHPVIVPITGDILNNPYYPYPGYHMLVVIGYSKDRIITNDNGTRRGANYSYDNETFEKAFQNAGGDILFFNLNKDQ